jgi:hypothetical protein
LFLGRFALPLQSQDFQQMNKRIFFAVFFILAVDTASAFVQLLAIPRLAASFATRANATKLATHLVGATLTYLVIDSAYNAYLRLTNVNDDLPVGWSDRTTPPGTSPVTAAASGYLSFAGLTIPFSSVAGADAGFATAIAKINTEALYPYKVRVNPTKPACTLQSTGVNGASAHLCYIQYENPVGSSIWYSLNVNLSISSSTQSCDTGYTLSGSSCVLSNAATVRYPVNGACEYVRSSDGSLIPNSRDKDCDGVALPATPIKTIVSTDATGRAVTDTKVTSLADGGTSITQEEYDWANNKTTTTTAVLNPAGTVTGITTQTVTGTATAPVVGSTPSNSIPTDIAREGTLQQINTKLAPPPPLNATVPTLYTPASLTYVGVLSSFQTRVSNAPAISSAQNFFTVDISGTSCPIWHIPSVMGMPSIPIDAQCSNTMNQIWPFVAAVIIATVGFVGFRWAFL